MNNTVSRQANTKRGYTSIGPLGRDYHAEQWWLVRKKSIDTRVGEGIGKNGTNNLKQNEEDSLAWAGRGKPPRANPNTKCKARKQTAMATGTPDQQ